MRSCACGQHFFRPVGKKGEEKEEKTSGPQTLVSSKSLHCNGESFGIINLKQAPSQIGDDSDVDDEELDRMAAAAADDLSDDELDA